MADITPQIAALKQAIADAQQVEGSIAQAQQDLATASASIAGITQNAQSILQQVIVSAQTQVTAIEAAVQPPPPSNLIRLKAGDDLQAAVNAVQPGQTIALEPRANWPTVRLPKKLGKWFLTTDGAQDLPGARVTATEATNFATLGGGNGPAITTDPGGGNVEVSNVAFLPNANSQTDRFSTIVALGTGMEKIVTDLADSVTLRRVFCFVDWRTKKQRRFVRAECTNFQFLDSRIEGIAYATPDDAQGFLTTNSPGPFLIDNCYVEATGENILFGGGDPQIKNLVPGEAGTVIRKCHLYKPLAWKYNATTNPTGLRGYVKNLLELKNARNVLVDGCVLENVWVDAQAGNALLLTVRNQDNSAPWSTLDNIEIRNTRIINASTYGIQLLGLDDDPGKVSVRAKDIRIINVQFEKCSRGVYVNNGPDGLLLDHVTFANTAGHFMSFEHAVTDRLVVQNILARSGNYGIHSPVGLGVAALKAYAPNYAWGTNAAEKSTQTSSVISFPPGTTILAAGAITWDATLGRYTPSVTGSDGKPMGSNLSAVPDPR